MPLTTYILKRRNLVICRIEPLVSAQRLWLYMREIKISDSIGIKRESLNELLSVRKHLKHKYLLHLFCFSDL